MKNSTLMAALVMTLGLSFAQAEETAAAAPAAPKKEAVAPAAKLSDEQAFATKLNDQNRKAFEQFTAEQKKAAMAAAAAQAGNKTALNPNDAVQKVLKENITVADKGATKVEAPAKAK